MNFLRQNLSTSLVPLAGAMSKLVQETYSFDKSSFGEYWGSLSFQRKCDYFQGLVALSPRVSKDLFLCLVLLIIEGHT